MSENFESRPRSSWDQVLFVVTFFGFLISSAGVVTFTVPLAIFGLLIMLLGVGYYILKQW